MPAVDVHGLLEGALRSRPDAPALADAEGSWTYRQLDAAVGRVHGWLAGRGVRPGARVACTLPASRYAVALMYACSRAGAVFVPLPPTMPAYHRDAILADVAPAVVVGADDPAPHGSADPAPVSPYPTAFLLYTSGSSTVPRGVVCPHAAVLAATRAIARRLRYRPDDVVYSRLPLSFDYGLYQALLAAQAGAALVLDAATPATGLLAAIGAHRASVVPVVPGQADLLAWFAARQPVPATVRLFTCTGAALSPATRRALVRRFPGARVSLMYGLTECKRVAISDPVDPAPSGSVGRALDGTRVAILDGARVSTDPYRPGEILVSGPHLMAGYWRAPELTAARYRTDPGTGVRWLHTGDRGYLDGDGNLYVLGRLDTTFSRHGVRMCVEEIEAAVMDVPGVRAAALVPPSGPDADDMVLVVVSELAPGRVLARVRQRVGPERTPRCCRVVAALPVTAHGKVDRRALAGLRDTPVLL